ncbi:ABC transporter substrate-binding protein [Paenibacillaceae bacterium]|nr:ABC transporter substrate-binding protein [Paenibacillaceae bacterium]
MKNMKYAAALIFIVLMGSALAACSDRSDKPASAVKVEAISDLKDATIGLSMQTLGAPYFVAQQKAVEREAEKIGVKVFSVDAQGDMNKQLSDVEDLLSKKIDLLIINPVDPMGAIAATKAAAKAGVPVIVMDNSISAEADYVTIIQSNNMDNGELVGIWLANKMGNTEVKLGVLSGNQGNLLGVDRRMGVIKGLVEEQLRKSNQTNFKVVTQGWGAWSQEGGLKAAEDMIVASPDMNVLVAENDSMALGALKAIQNAGKEGKILVLAAADGQKEALELIKEGKYGATGLNDPALVAKTTLETAVKYLQGDTNIPKLINTEAQVISSDNVDKYYNKDADF